LPKEHEQTAPGFEHHPGATLPEILQPGVRMRLIAGSAFGRTAPATTFSPLFYLAVDMEAGARLVLPTEYPQRAVYVVDGDVSVEQEAVAERHMAVLPAGQEITIEARTASRLMLLGGDPLDGDRFIWWNFVASSKELILQAKEKWRSQNFGRVPEETEWIPLPDEPKPAESFS